MAASSLQRLRGLIRAERTLAVLLPEAERLALLNSRLAAALPPAIARRSRVMALEDANLLVHCDNGAAASRLRSQSASLAKLLSSPSQPVLALKIKVRADWSRADKADKPGLGTTALSALDALEVALPDGQLKTALARMIEHQRR